jgi:hypothetical protein
MRPYSASLMIGSCFLVGAVVRVMRSTQPAVIRQIVAEALYAGASQQQDAGVGATSEANRQYLALENSTCFGNERTACARTRSFSVSGVSAYWVG